jgi:hypothetical protein
VAPTATTPPSSLHPSHLLQNHSTYSIREYSCYIQSTAKFSITVTRTTPKLEAAIMETPSPQVSPGEYYYHGTFYSTRAHILQSSSRH